MQWLLRVYKTRRAWGHYFFSPRRYPMRFQHSSHVALQSTNGRAPFRAVNFIISPLLLVEDEKFMARNIFLGISKTVNTFKRYLNIATAISG